MLFILLPFGALTPSGEGSDDSSILLQPVWTLVYLASIVGLFVERRRAWPLIRKSLPVLTIVGLIVASSFWSDYHDISLKRALELVGTSGTAYFIVTHFRLVEFLECWAIALGSAACMSFLFIFAFPSRGLMQDEYAGTWRGIFNHKNALGQAMAFGVVTVVLVLLAKVRVAKAKMPTLAAATLCLALLIGSRSASSYLMFVVLAGFLVSFVVSNSDKGRRFLWPALICGALVVLIAALNSDAVVNALGRDTSLSGRTDIWEPVLAAIGNRPWFGYGYDTFWLPDGTGSAYMPYLLEWAPWSAHQGLLELTLDIGIVGDAVFLCVLAIGLRRAWTYMRRWADVESLWPLLAMVYFVVANISEANIAKFNGTNWIVFLVAFLYVSVPRVPSEHRAKA